MGESLFASHTQPSQTDGNAWTIEAIEYPQPEQPSIQVEIRFCDNKIESNSLCHLPEPFYFKFSKDCQSRISHGVGAVIENQGASTPYPFSPHDSTRVSRCILQKMCQGAAAEEAPSCNSYSERLKQSMAVRTVRL